MVFSGANVRVAYEYETNFREATTVMTNLFGVDAKVNSINTTNNSNILKALGSPEPVARVDGLFSTTFSIESSISNGKWLRAMTGNAPNVSGNEYVYLDTANGLSLNSTIPSISVYVEYPTHHELLSGAVVKSAEISIATGETVKISLDMEASYLDTAASASISTSDEVEVLNFAHASIELPTGTTLLKVDKISIKINRNLELIGAVGSRIYQDVVGKVYDYEVSLSVPYESVELLNKVLGGSSPAVNRSNEVGLRLIVDNGKTGTDQRVLELKFADISIDELNKSLSPEDKVMQDITLHPLKWTYAKWIGGSG